MSTSAERRAQNETLFRDLNERVKEIDERLEPSAMGAEPLDLEFLCECGSIECADRFPMAREEYEAVRKHPAHFVVLPGHVNADIEHVVASNGTYVIVEKEDEFAEIARARDPRE